MNRASFVRPPFSAEYLLFYLWTTNTCKHIAQSHGAPSPSNKYCDASLRGLIVQLWQRENVQHDIHLLGRNLSALHFVHPGGDNNSQLEFMFVRIVVLTSKRLLLRDYH